MAIWEHSNYDPAGARRRVADDMGQDWIKDPIFRADQLRRLNDDPERIRPLLERDYQPRRGRPVPVPKTSLTVRPAVDLAIQDRVAYQVLTDTFGHELLADLSPFVKGWRYKQNPNSTGDLLDNGLEWRNYERLLDFEWNQGCEYILVTDIASFFQNIRHSLLRDQLSGIDQEVVEKLFFYLRTWSPSGSGLPQRVLSSSLLANAYLAPLDQVLADYRCVRWMDDIALFCSSRSEGVEAMLRIQEALHSLDLSPNPSKTFLVPHDQAANLILDLRRRSIEYRLSIGDPEGTADQDLSDIWSRIVEKPDGVDRTEFSFCVTKLMAQDKGDATEDILALLDRLPHVSDHASRYLRAQLGQKPVLDGLVPFLKSAQNLFSWQEFRLATLFWHSSALTEEQLSFVRQRAADRNVHWSSRNIYLRVVGKHGTDADLRTMKHLAETEPDVEVLRGLIIGAVEAGVSKTHANVMARGEADLKELVRYLNGRDWSLPQLSF